MKKFFTVLLAISTISAFAETNLDCYTSKNNELKGSIQINGAKAKLINWSGVEGESVEFAVKNEKDMIVIDYNNSKDYLYPIYLTSSMFEGEYSYAFLEKDNRDGYCVVK